MNKPRLSSRLPQGSILQLVPNILTILSLTSGLTAIQFALEARFDHALLAVLAAALFDTMDGAAARLLKATSDLGAQLDSLSDFLSFGIAPSIILYLWLLEDVGPIGWIAMLVFSIASALRLARYNSGLKSYQKDWAKGFFVGVPTPAGAGLALLPMFIWLAAPEEFGYTYGTDVLICLWIIFSAGLMVSRLPTWSLKRLRVKRRMSMPALVIATLIIAFLIEATWLAMSVFILAYVATIPLSVRHFKKLSMEREDPVDLTDLALGFDPEDK